MMVPTRGDQQWSMKNDSDDLSSTRESGHLKLKVVPVSFMKSKLLNRYVNAALDLPYIC